MLKWIFVFMVGIAALTLFLQFKVNGVTEERAVVLQAQAVPVAVAGVEEGVSAAAEKGVARLTVAEERMTHRVPPVQEAPIQGEILLQ